MLQNSEFDALAACREVIDDVERRYTKGVCPPISLVGKLGNVRESIALVGGDKERFKQVIMHLLANAVAATDKSGKVCAKPHCGTHAVFKSMLTIKWLPPHALGRSSCSCPSWRRRCTRAG
jgi:signal transduction histidine kinase